MKCKPQASRNGRLTAFYESREYLTDGEVPEERYNTERIQQDHPKERSNRRYRRRRKRRESRRHEDSDTIIDSSEIFNLGSAAMNIAIDMVLTAFDPCGALQDVFPEPHRDDPLNPSRRHRKSRSEEIHLERTLTVRSHDDDGRGCEDGTLISGLTDVFT